ncbi:hypothetical protein BJ878DRAFT_522311 [Calycina marina]|uniref:Uncharacterized protein n=1 Tax=Calycina marina TaxID=1763456 RepID=A0A9P8CBM7_9HELO|nr:hypothetical protein BJ878DRAFT_522311 [Calycina marina]
MPKAKQFLKAKKPSKHAKPAPTTADEYLEAGVEYEEAGEKWRGGDALKSLRAFHRAIECYEEGLKKFPRSFDLAYNKSRVQFELTQHPKLCGQLVGAVSGHLEVALESSRYALKLKEDNADVLFNTAQILTSLVEVYTEDRTNTHDPLPPLKEALELFQRCQNLQEFSFTESQAQQASMSQGLSYEDSEEMSDVEEGGVSLDQKGPATAQEEQWAAIVEPVTNDTLLDTLLAQLQCLTTFCSLLPPDPARGLVWIEEYSTPLLITKLPAYLTTANRQTEAGLTRANFLSALADASFRCQSIDISTYLQAISDAFSQLSLSTDPEGLVNRAEALMSYNSSVRLAYSGRSKKDVFGSRWKALSNALESLTAASKLPTAENIPKIHLVRGDTELLRYQLGREGYELAAKSSTVLIKNAETFYRGAGALAKSSGASKELVEANIKQALTQAIGGNTANLQEAVKLERGTKAILEEAIDDGLVSIQELAGKGFA